MKLTLRTSQMILSRRRLTILAMFVAVLVGLAGASGLVYPSSYSPLLFLGGILVIGMVVAWLMKPVWALYAAVFLVFLPTGLISTSVHSMLNRIVTVIAVIVCIVRMFSAHKRIVWTGSALFMLLFLTWSSVSLLWAEKMGPATTVLQAYSLRFLLFLLLIPNEIHTRNDLDGLMKALALSGWVLMLSVIATVLLEGYKAGSRLQIFGENENAAGMLALLTMVGVVWQASQASKTHRIFGRLTIAIFILLTFGLVVMSGSRGSAISLVLTLSTFWLWKCLRAWGKFGFLIAIMALLLVPSIYATLVERFGVQNSGIGGRAVLWQAAWHVIQDHPWTGVGIGNAPYASIQYLETVPHMLGAQRAVVHNPLLTVWSETAIAGILLYLAVLMSAVYSFGKQYLKFRRSGSGGFTLYFALVASIAIGYLASWFKSGGVESHFSYFLIVALLNLPSGLDASSFRAIPSAIQLPTSRA